MDKELFLIIAVVLGVSGVFYTRGKQTQAELTMEEAKLQLLLIHRLEQAHFLDTGRFVGFEQQFGAPLLGTDQCEQPDGAKELGFKLRNCKVRASSAINIKYFYTIRLTSPSGSGPGFIATAASGSRADGQNLVCVAAGQDIWTINEHKQIAQVETCQSP